MEIRLFSRRDLLKMLLIYDQYAEGWEELPFSYLELCAELTRRDKRV